MEVLTTCTDPNYGKPRDCGDLMIDEVFPKQSIMEHENSVDALDANPRGGTFASASHDTTIMLWDAARIKRVSTLTGHAKGVWSVAHSPDGSQLVSASPDTTARIWDTKSGKAAAILRDHDFYVSTPIF